MWLSGYCAQLCVGASALSVLYVHARAGASRGLSQVVLDGKACEQSPLATHPLERTLDGGEGKWQLDGCHWCKKLTQSYPVFDINHTRISVWHTQCPWNAFSRSLIFVRICYFKICILWLGGNTLLSTWQVNIDFWCCTFTCHWVMLK